MSNRRCGSARGATRVERVVAVGRSVSTPPQLQSGDSRWPYWKGRVLCRRQMLGAEDGGGRSSRLSADISATTTARYTLRPRNNADGVVVRFRHLAQLKLSRRSQPSGRAHAEASAKRGLVEEPVRHALE